MHQSCQIRLDPTYMLCHLWLMVAKNVLISTDRQAQETEVGIAELDAALSSDQTLKSIVAGLPREVIEGVRRSLATERRGLSEAVEAYQQAKQGDATALKSRAGNDPGALLIAARIIRRLSQKELARKLGLREQQIQRYEAERYRSISLHGFKKVASVLGAQIAIDLSSRNLEWTVSHEAPKGEELSKVLRHARAHGWLEDDQTGEKSDEKAISQLVRYVADHVLHHGTPSLLRAGLNAVADPGSDWALLSWKAQVTRVAEGIIAESKPRYRSIDVSWLTDLVRLSRLDDGPIRARDMLLEHGIVLVVEPHIVGMKIDGAAFLVDGVPVIGLTILRDYIDNFWFTLLHEVGHVVLHYWTGLSSGFFDDMSSADVDEFENEANIFSGNLFIPEEVWRQSPARISRSPEPIERFAQKLGIHPAIVFGRIRLERNDHSIFATKVGRGQIRRQLFNLELRQPTR